MSRVVVDAIAKILCSNYTCAQGAFFLMSLPDDKPVSVLHLATKRQPFLLAGDLSPAPATYPELVTERAAPGPLFGLAPHGVCPASEHYCRRGALLPHHFTLTETSFRPLRRYIFCGTFRKIRFERIPPAVSRHAALWRPDFPLRRRCRRQSGCQSGRPGTIMRVLRTGGKRGANALFSR